MTHTAAALSFPTILFTPSSRLDGYNMLKQSQGLASPGPPTHQEEELRQNGFLTVAA